MEDELHSQLAALERSLAEFEAAAKRTLGFLRTVEYRGIAFNVGRRFVIADLSPLAFMHLVEHIETTPEDAVVRLYDRLLPLLSCRHHWTPLRRAEDEHMLHLCRSMAKAHICKVCTAYALEGSLPEVGRGI
jgi:hypothetical protein